MWSVEREEIVYFGGVWKSNKWMRKFQEGDLFRTLSYEVLGVVRTTLSHLRQDFPTCYNVFDAFYIISVANVFFVISHIYVKIYSIMENTSCIF